MDHGHACSAKRAAPARRGRYCHCTTALPVILPLFALLTRPSFYECILFLVFGADIYGAELSHPFFSIRQYLQPQRACAVKYAVTRLIKARSIATSATISCCTRIASGERVGGDIARTVVCLARGCLDQGAQVCAAPEPTAPTIAGLGGLYPFRLPPIFLPLHYSAPDCSASRCSHSSVLSFSGISSIERLFQSNRRARSILGLIRC